MTVRHSQLGAAGRLSQISSWELPERRGPPEPPERQEHPLPERRGPPGHPLPEQPGQPGRREHPLPERRGPREHPLPEQPELHQPERREHPLPGQPELHQPELHQPELHQPGRREYRPSERWAPATDRRRSLPSERNPP